MPVPKHDKAPARWMVVGGTVIATVGFLIAITNGPAPANAGTAQNPVPLVASNQSSFSSVGDDGMSSGFNQPSLSSRRARFRSRGS